MGRRSTTEEFIQKAKQKHENTYDYSQTVYVSDKIKVKIICPKHGSFEQRPSSHLKGSGCPACARIWSDEHKRNHAESSRKSRGMTTEEWVERARKVHGDKYDYSKTIYVNQRTKVRIMCPFHGMFEQKADSHLRGSGCWKCWNEFGDHSTGHQWTDEQRAKTESTCYVRYGTKRYLDSEEGRMRLLEIVNDSEHRKRMSNIISSHEVQEKAKRTYMERYGVEHPMKLLEIMDKVAESKRNNGSWSTSRPEETMYIVLCDRFGESDIVRQYKDARYPFHCDFYVRSLDLFIELNATWLHGGHWFDENNQDDLYLLKTWQEKIHGDHKFYQSAIDVWTVRDVRKHRAALSNHLNYVVFWDQDLSDFMNWLEADELLLNNIL